MLTPYLSRLFLFERSFIFSYNAQMFTFIDSLYKLLFWQGLVSLIQWRKEKQRWQVDEARAPNVLS